MKKTVKVIIVALLALHALTSIVACKTEPSESGPTQPVGKAIATLEELKDAVKTEGEYYLSADFAIEGNLEITAPITLDGNKHVISVQYTTTCTICDENGQETDTCAICQGSGQKTCTGCNGNGYYGDDPTETCSDCGGLRTQSCPLEVTVTCRNCGGTKKRTYSNSGLVIKSAGVTVKNVKFESKDNSASNGNGLITVDANGTNEEPIVIESCSFDSKKTMTTEELKESAIVSTYNGAAYLTVKNCTIKNMNYGMYFKHIENAVIKNNTIESTLKTGIIVLADNSTYTCKQVKINNNTITDYAFASDSDEMNSCGIAVGNQSSDIDTMDNNFGGSTTTNIYKQPTE